MFAYTLSVYVFECTVFYIQCISAILRSAHNTCQDMLICILNIYLLRYCIAHREKGENAHNLIVGSAAQYSSISAITPVTPI